MSRNILNLIDVQQLSTEEQKAINGGHLDGIIDDNPNVSFKCYRNNSGNRFFISPIDLSSPTTVCFPFNPNYQFDDSISDPLGPVLN